MATKKNEVTVYEDESLDVNARKVSNMATKKNEVTVYEDGSLDVNAVMDMVRRNERITLAETDSTGMAADILERTLRAETKAELWADVALTKAQEVVGLPLFLLAVEFRNSDYDEEGIGIYAVLSARTADGEVVTIGCGSKNVVVKCIKAKAIADALPQWVKFAEDTTKAGYKVLNLLAVPDPF